MKPELRDKDKRDEPMKPKEASGLNPRSEPEKSKLESTGPPKPSPRKGHCCSWVSTGTQGIELPFSSGPCMRTRTSANPEISTTVSNPISKTFPEICLTIAIHKLLERLGPRRH